jgi:branched-chain amino acid transport system permease protein
VALLLQALITGLAAGAGYGLLAVGYTLVFRLTGVIHFALGELMSLAVFTALFVAGGTGIVTRTNLSGWRWVLAAAAGVGVSVAANVLVYRFALRPFLRRGLTMGWIAASLAVAFYIRGVLQATFVRASYVLPDPFPFARYGRNGAISLPGGVTVPIRTFYVLGAAALLSALAAWLLGRTSFGLGLRAIANDRVAAELIGLPMERLLMQAFALAGGIAALAALLEGPAAPVTVDTGALLGLNGLIAALAVGFATPWRALGAGLALGVLEALLSTASIGNLRLGPGYASVIPAALVLLALAVRRPGAGAFVEAYHED